jgi:hypothetical protein
MPAMILHKPRPDIVILLILFYRDLVLHAKFFASQESIGTEPVSGYGADWYGISDYCRIVLP